MNNLSNSLCRTSISKHLIDDLKKRYRNKIDSTILKSISKDINDKKEYKDLEKSIKQIKHIVSEDLYDLILEEQVEIKEDLKWIGTKRGKYITELNEWHQSFYAEFRLKKEFENVFIGGHTVRLVVFLTGKVSNQENYQKLLDYINSKNPPFKLIAQIEIPK